VVEANPAAGGGGKSGDLEGRCGGKRRCDSRNFTRKKMIIHGPVVEEVGCFFG
jgi:hypothetical protein